MSFRAVCAALVSVIFAVPAGAAEFAAGAAQIVITPPTGYPMWGYGARHDAPSVAVRDQLRARAVVIGVGEERLAIVSLDLGRAPTRDSMSAIRQKVLAAGIKHVMLVGSHTHHGPVLELDSWPVSKKPYVRELEEKLTTAILEAKSAARAARWGAASKDVDLNRNRQSKRPDAPVDRGLTVVRIEDMNAKPIAHLVNFAAHPTMLDAKLLQFSADYAGALAVAVEESSQAPCLFLQGAAGDMSVKPADGRRDPDTFGRALAKEVVQLSTSIRCAEPKQPTLKVETEDFKFAARLDVSNPVVKRALGTAFFPDLIVAYEREYRDGVRPQLTVALLDERLGLVGVSGEFFCGHALSLRRRARLEHLLFLGYCNDYQQYFPTIEAASEGGYGTTPPVGMAELGAGERMMDRALVHLYRMRGLLP